MTAVERKKEAKTAPSVTKCKGCGIKFMPSDYRQKFHNEQCREEYYARTYFRKTSVDKVCPQCGNTFTTSMPKKQVFCSADCRKTHRESDHEELMETVDKTRYKFYGDRFKTLKSAEFRCSYCGKDVSDNIKLDVEPIEDGGYRTICSECVMGKEYNDV